VGWHRTLGQSLALLTGCGEAAGCFMRATGHMRLALRPERGRVGWPASQGRVSAPSSTTCPPTHRASQKRTVRARGSERSAASQAGPSSTLMAAIATQSLIIAIDSLFHPCSDSSQCKGITGLRMHSQRCTNLSSQTIGRSHGTCSWRKAHWCSCRTVLLRWSWMWQWVLQGRHGLSCKLPFLASLFLCCRICLWIKTVNQ
jgi:hypothetical protein